MSTYEIELEDKSFVLDSDKCSVFMNDEENPITGMDAEGILTLLNESDKVYFYKEYYDQACEVCHKNRKEGSKYFGYQEFHFYLFAKDQAYVMSSLSEGYQGKSVKGLFKEGIADGSYIVSINVCEECGDFTIELEFGTF